MRLISEAVHEGAGAALECRDDARGNENRAERRVTAGDSFSHENHVRLDVPVLRSKRFSGTAHASHHFVRDEENSVFVADFRDARGVAFGRHGGARVAPPPGSETKAAAFPASCSNHSTSRSTAHA